MISIIANFYKSGKYIPRLMKSVAAQTYTDWQLICIDDCSPENDSEIITICAKRYDIQSKVRIIRNPENLGIALSKKVGIDAAEGEYITFIDGDDWLAPEALERMHAPMKQHHLDMAIMNYYRYFTPFYKTICKSYIKSEHWDKALEKEVFVKHYLMNFFAENIFNVAYWAKMYNAQLLKALDFEYPPANKSVREDFLFSMAWFQAVDRIMFVNYEGYYWRYGGITTGNRINEDWSTLKYINNNADMYPLRKAVIEKYDYQEGMFPLLAQLKNLLIWSISRIAKYDNDTPEAAKIKEYVKEVLDHPSYADIKYLLDYNPTPATKDIIRLIMNKDTDGIYALCRSNYKSQRKERVINKIKHLVIAPFL